MSTHNLNEAVDNFTTSLISDIQSKSSIVEIQDVKITKNDTMKTKIDKLLIILQQPNHPPVLCHGITRDVQKLISIIEIVKQKHQDQLANGSRSKLHQYNCLLRVRTKENPYKKQSKSSSSKESEAEVEVVDFTKALKVAGARQEDRYGRPSYSDVVSDKDGNETVVHEANLYSNYRDTPAGQGAIRIPILPTQREIEENKKKKVEKKKTKVEKEADEARMEIIGDKVYDVPVMYVLLSTIDLSSCLDSDWTVQC